MNILKHDVSVTKKKNSVWREHQPTRLTVKTADYSCTLNGNGYKSCRTCTEVVPERTRKHFIEVGKNSVGKGTIFSSF